MRPSDDAIRERSYLIWEREGRPDGRAGDHWLRAEAELLAEGAAGQRQRPATPARRGTGRKAGGAKRAGASKPKA